MVKTPIINRNEKLDIMDHLNQDHQEELLVVANYYGKQGEYTQAIIEDIFEEGVVLSAIVLGQSEKIYIPFSIEGSLEERILYLAYYVLTKQGESLRGSRKQFFQVNAKSAPSNNILRVEVKSITPLPEYYAGYTYGVVLKKISNPKALDTTIKKKGFFARIFNHIFIGLLRILNSKNRVKLIEAMNKDIRLYTLRFSRKNEQHQVTNGAIDVYFHGDSPGGSWVRQLKEGDIIVSRTEVADKHEYLRQGKNVLIGDEAAFPALAGILELWDNPEPPIVMALMNDEVEKKYFQNILMPKGTDFRTIVYKNKKQSDLVIKELERLDHIDGAWGGFERDEAKKVRHFIRNTLSIDGMKNHVKGYWASK